jgi:hypothetical protein
MMPQDVAAVMEKPISQELLGSSIPARFSYVGLDGDPRVAITIDTGGYPPHVLLIRGAASVELLDGVPDDYVEASRRLVPADQFDAWEAGVRTLYAQMARITVEPDWAKLLDFETTIPKAVEDLVLARQQRTS